MSNVLMQLFSCPYAFTIRVDGALRWRRTNEEYDVMGDPFGARF